MPVSLVQVVMGWRFGCSVVHSEPSYARRRGKRRNLAKVGMAVSIVLPLAADNATLQMHGTRPGDASGRVLVNQGAHARRGRQKRMQGICRETRKIFVQMSLGRQ
jgi:hypothetical protein